jgi:RimJ/RimL family protein N-acetyltransferase
VELLTPRLRLVPFEVQHGPALADVYADADVARHLGGDRLTREAALAQAQRFADIWDTHGHGQSALLERSTGRFVGRVGLHPWPAWDELELGWVIARTHQRQGLATEAASAWLAWCDEHRPADHLIAVIHPDNEPSIATARRLGFAADRDDEVAGGPVVVFRRELDAVRP